MKIYFSAAIYSKDQKGKYYERIIGELKRQGHEVLTYGVVESSIEEIRETSNEALTRHYRKVLQWITKADAVVVEASFPSTIHIGHEISVALDKGKPVIALYEAGQVPFFLTGINNDKLALVEYSADDLEVTLKHALEYIKDVQDTRFNFFISPNQQNYLDWVAKKKRVPRAVYLRKLIEQAMEKDEEYSG